jgi:hypothetical protein
MRKYLTEIRDDQRDWIKQAAEEMQYTHKAIVQIAIDRLMQGDWASVKAEIKTDTARKQLREIDEQIRNLQAQKDALQDAALV